MESETESETGLYTEICTKCKEKVDIDRDYRDCSLCCDTNEYCDKCSQDEVITFDDENFYICIGCAQRYTNISPDELYSTPLCNIDVDKTNLALFQKALKPLLIPNNEKHEF
jgi:hypothetical protein